MKKTLSILLSLLLLLGAVCAATLPAFAAPEDETEPPEPAAVDTVLVGLSALLVREKSAENTYETDGSDFLLLTLDGKTTLWTPAAFVFPDIRDKLLAALKDAAANDESPLYGIAFDDTLAFADGTEAIVLREATEDTAAVTAAPPQGETPLTADAEGLQVLTGSYTATVLSVPGKLTATAGETPAYAFPADDCALVILQAGAPATVWSNNALSDADKTLLADALNAAAAAENSLLAGCVFDAARFVFGKTPSVTTEAEPLALTLDENNVLAALPEELLLFTGTFHKVDRRDTAATCTEADSHALVCTACQAVCKTLSVDAALGHDISAWTSVEASDPPTHTGVCARCEETIPALCVFEDTSTESEPTCTTNGAEIASCKCGRTEKKSIPALGHDVPEWTQTVDSKAETHVGLCVRADCGMILEDCVYEKTGTKTEPTCTEAGVEIQSCAKCGRTREKPVDKLGHDLSEWKPVAESDPPQHGAICSRCGGAVTDNCVFNDDNVLVEPSCTEEGKMVKVCVCGSVFKDEYTLPALGHDYIYTDNEDGTCTGTCSRCLLETDAAAHSFVYTDNNDGTHTGTCSRCQRKTESAAHTFPENWDERKKATCTEAGEIVHSCTVGCGAQETQAVPAVAHNKKLVDNGDGTHSEKCETCSTVFSTAAHSFGAWKQTSATCTTAGSKTHACTVCKASETLADGDALGHNYKLTARDAAKGTLTYTCTRCNQQYTAGGQKLDPTGSGTGTGTGTNPASPGRPGGKGPSDPVCTGDSAVLAAAAGVLLLAGTAVLVVRKKKD